MKYQKDYASLQPKMYETKERIRKASRMYLLLKDYFSKYKIPLSELSVLDIGSSTGIIDNHLSRYFKSVTGIDIDKDAVVFAQKTFKQKNLKFKVDDAMKLSFPSNSFDIVICAQIYEHVPNAKKLMSEIYRVLKPNGVCYFAALNKFWPIEPHYNLPFLAWIPKKYAHHYLRLIRKGNHYYETIKTPQGLKKLCEKFTIIRYTGVILRNPQKYGFENQINSPLKRIFAFFISPISNYTAPTLFWILKKPIT
ncbi:hypothetical protein A2382_00605 [Candidatus Woesebacteria bacterium RIFOXYB1_FULL_38_16]|uniref:Methyltransferase type 11 domain-containing protein n=1 Tax=Candidatus Woesebacteria bacterium RIFOXYB1_FULL_38_16 TaxID=1802538 RepID=A0A1F8CSJ8_9BACT|nr:MAG: hypothetical protein A2191_01485 [Candidatus Woesebacteria bacterium RIFOXYA1_FULL_38_9]OGM79270.1 MAG: hypothetical protein A2382_00605 [Candidatus Woesebacteria bacterium RIFOXYB1_FULL_38_16]